MCCFREACRHRYFREHSELDIGEIFTEYLKVNNKVYDDTGTTTDGPADRAADDCRAVHSIVQLKTRIQHECKIVTLLFCIL